MSFVHGKVVLITGASSGIGLNTASELMKQGYKVYGTSRKANGSTRTNSPAGDGFLEMIPLDVRNDESVQTGIRHVLDKEGRLDILINNAGMGIAGAIEDTSIDEARMQIETNFFGVVRMCRAVLPIMREQKKGLIITIGSVGGIFSIPFQAFYSCSKFALEALIESLRIETKEFGIRASLVEPGDTKTQFTANRVKAEQSKTNPAYRKHFEKALNRMIHDEENGPEPIVVTKCVLKILNKKNPPIRIIAGFNYKLMCFLKRILPARFVESVMASMY